VKAVVRACWDILFLRRPPQVFPKSWALFSAVLAVYLVSDSLTFFSQKIFGLQALQETVFDTCLQLAFFGLLLASRFALQKLNQTLTAWLGAGIIINLVSLPANAAALVFTSDAAQPFLLVPQVLITAWGMAVMAHILRHTLDFRPLFGLDLGLIYGLVIAAVYVIVQFLMFSALFPG
jgi:hypothetical protein